MLYLDETFLAAIRSLTIREVARDLNVSYGVVHHLTQCTEGRDGEEGIGKVETLAKVCEYVNRRKGTSFSLATVVKTARPRFLQSYGGITLFLGGKQVLSNVTQIPHLSVTDVRAALDLLGALRRAFDVQPADVQFALALSESLAGACALWRSSSDRFKIVIGSPLVNGIFPVAYGPIWTAFDKAQERTLVFVWHSSREIPLPVPEPDKKERGRKTEKPSTAALDYVDWARAWTEVGITCPGQWLGERDDLFLRREPRPRSPKTRYRDVAFVIANSHSAILGGHGSLGTRGAIRLFEQHWRWVQEDVETAGACVLLSQVHGSLIDDFTDADVEVRSVHRLAPGRRIGKRRRPDISSLPHRRSR